MGVGAPRFSDYGVPATEGDRDFFLELAECRIVEDLNFDGTG